MPSGGQIGSGVKIAYSANSPVSWTRVPELTDVTPPTFERDDVEITTHGTTSLRQYIPGLADVTDLEFTMLANLTIGSVCTALSSLERSQTTVWWRVEIPVSSDLATTNYFAYQFQGKVKTWAVESPIDDAKIVNVVVKFNDNFMIQQEMASEIS